MWYLHANWNSTYHLAFIQAPLHLIQVLMPCRHQFGTWYCFISTALWGIIINWNLYGLVCIPLYFDNCMYSYSLCSDMTIHYVYSRMPRIKNYHRHHCITDIFQEMRHTISKHLNNKSWGLDHGNTFFHHRPFTDTDLNLYFMKSVTHSKKVRIASMGNVSRKCRYSFSSDHIHLVFSHMHDLCFAQCSQVDYRKILKTPLPVSNMTRNRTQV